MSASNREEMGKALWQALKENTPQSNKAALELLKLGADPNYLLISKQNSLKNRPLHLAVSNNDINMIRQLIAHNADLSIKNANPNTPLTYAALEDRWNCVVELAKYKTWANASTSFGTALFIALKVNQPQSIIVAKALLAASINPNLCFEVAKTGTWSTLHYAVRNADEEIIRLLLENGATPQLLNDKKQTALQLAIASQNWAGINAYSAAKKNIFKDARRIYLVLRQGHEQEGNLFRKLPLELLVNICQYFCTEFTAKNIPTHSQYKKIIADMVVEDKRQKQAAAELPIKQAAAFKIIYQMLRAGTTVIFADEDFLEDKENLSPSELIKYVETAVKIGGKKNAMIAQAWKLAQEHYLNCEPSNIPLFKGAYDWAFANSTFGISKMTGTTFLSSRSVCDQTFFLTKEKIARASLNESSRTGKMYRIITTKS